MKGETYFIHQLLKKKDDLFLYSYETYFIHQLLKKKDDLFLYSYETYFIHQPLKKKDDLFLYSYETYFIHQLLKKKDDLFLYSASKRNYAKRNKTALGPRGQAETSLKIEDLRSNKTTGKLS
jgi:phospholipid N-methyltransferase